MRHRIAAHRLWLGMNGIRFDGPLGTETLSRLPRDRRLVRGLLEKGYASARWFRGPSLTWIIPHDGLLMVRPRRSPPVNGPRLRRLLVTGIGRARGLVTRRSLVWRW
jgi:hypothetical protein